ncbi:hypothetical protein [Melittangium boletus]|nr:hypothetical protein [Melittangium boletus]
MSSTYLHLTDEELLARIARLSGDVTLVRAQNRETGEFCIGLCERAAGKFMPLSTHTDEASAMRAGAEFAARLDRLAAEQPELQLRHIH